jgi:hypothetical protein
MTRRILKILAGGTAAAAMLTAGGAAAADVFRTLEDVTLSDGGTLSGVFSIDTYGFIGSLDLQSTAGTDLGATTYDGDRGGNSSISIDPSRTAITVNFDSQYDNTLYLQFQSPLTAGSADDAIVSGFECFGSYSCDTAANTRTVTGGFASAPEPAAWALMIVGLGCVGGGLRHRTRRLA